MHFAVQIGRVTMSQQFDNFQKTKAKIALLIGQPGADELISNAIYSFTVGGNDYVNNYLAVTTTTQSTYTPPQFQDLLITTFKAQLQVYTEVILLLYPVILLLYRVILGRVSC